MAQETKQLLGIVIRADGTVPFDDAVTEEHRAHTLAWLTDHGHIHAAVPGTRHVKIVHWPRPLND
jgi:hypothetical protein